jgi:hypothetical protein
MGRLRVAVKTLLSEFLCETGPREASRMRRTDAKITHHVPVV